MNRYVYDGPVMEFGNCVSKRWSGETFAESEKKARSNLSFRWKREHGRSAGCKITLSGNVKLIDRKGF